MAVKDTKALKIYIAEQERFHDELTAANAGLKVRLTTYIGAILALLAFLYVSALDSSKTPQARLFIPHELYGQIFYITGLFFILYALGRLIHGMRPNGFWSVGYDSTDLKKVESLSEEEYLMKLKNDNDNARRSNVDDYNRRQSSLKDAFYPMLIGAIMMIVLRYFQ